MIKIIGSGDIASALKETSAILVDSRLYYASGVSNPNEMRESEYLREKDLLAKQRKDLQIVYFSSLNVHYSKTRYSEHKREMEKLVRRLFPYFAIARIGIITWGNNPNTTINFLRGKVIRGEPFQIREVTRDVLEKSEFIRQVNLMPKHNCVVEFHGQIMTELEIFKKYVHPRIYSKKV